MAARNFLVIMMDELAIEGVGCYGGTGLTPNIDRLAAAGTLFRNAYTPAPICVPARAAFQTGRYNYETGHFSNAQPYRGDPPGWGHRLREAGCETVSIGKLHYGAAGEDHGFAREIVPLYVKDGNGWIHGLLRRQDHSCFDTAGYAADVKAGEDDYTDYDRVVRDRAVDWLKTEGTARRNGKPWALFVSFLRPHYPLSCPQDWLALYDPEKLPAIRNAGPRTELRNPVVAASRLYNDFDDHFADDAARNLARACYFGLCSFVDDLLGDVLKTLEETGRDKDTVICLTADHGDMNGHHGLWTKMTMYEEAIRIPMILAGPGVPRGECGTQASLIDIHQTAIAATGMQLTAADMNLHGRCLITLANASTDPGRAVLSEYHDGGSITAHLAMREGKWKYVCYPGFAPQLFDLQADPHEQNDLGLSDRHAPIRERMHDRLVREFADPDAINAHAFASQDLRIAELGGLDGINARRNYDHTPVSYPQEARPERA